MNAFGEQRRDCKGTPRGTRCVFRRSLTVAALMVGCTPLSETVCSAFPQVASQFDAAASRPATSQPERDQMVRWRQTFFWAAVVVLIFFFAVLAIIRFTMRYRAYLFREKNPPTPHEDVWKMHRLPEEDDRPGD